jgi:hypothetical protein
MKIASLVARYLLGLIFLVFGLNGFLHFLPMRPMPGPAGAFMTGIASSPYILVIFACQLIGGILLLSGQFVPLGLTLLGPVIVNIIAFHLFLAPSGLVVALLVLILWILAAWPYRARFFALLQRT